MPDAPDYDINTGVSTYHPANGNELVDVAGFRTLRQLVYGGSFEGYTTIGVGVRARLPFRASSFGEFVMAHASELPPLPSSICLASV